VEKEAEIVSDEKAGLPQENAAAKVEE